MVTPIVYDLNNMISNNCVFELIKMLFLKLFI